MDKDKQSGIPSLSESSETDIAASIGELENLIAENGISSGLSPKLHAAIPVLNDIVDPAEVIHYTQSKILAESSNSPVDEIEQIPSDRLDELMDTVDQKLSNELDSLVDILKDTIKDSIIDELKQQLKKEAPQTDKPVFHTDTLDKTPE